MNRVNLFFMAFVLGLGLSGCVATMPPNQPPAAQTAPAPVAPRLQAEQTQVYFEADSTIISDTSWKTLENVARVVRMNKDLHIHLIGRTDETQNASLALRRAIAVRNALSQLGLNPERITVQDETMSDSVLSRQAAEKHPAERKSRRVDIIVEPLQGEEI